MNFCFISIIALFVFFTITYSLLTPAFEGPDEIAHYIRAKQIADTGYLPHFGQQTPPLYYYVAGPFLKTIDYPDDLYGVERRPDFHLKYWPKMDMNRFLHGEEEIFPFTDSARAVHYLRILSILCGVVTIIFTYKIAQLIFKQDKWLPLFTMATVALIPKFVFINSVVHYDVLAWSLFSALIYFLFRYVDDQNNKKYLIYVGIFSGLAILTRQHAVIIYGIVLVIFLFLLLSKQYDLRKFFKNYVIFAVTALAVGGWQYLQRIIGDTANRPFEISNLIIQHVKSELVVPWERGFYFLFQYGRTHARLFDHLWGRLGWHTIVPSDEFTKFGNALIYVAAAGLFLIFVKKISLSQKLERNHIMMIFTIVGFMTFFFIAYNFVTGSGDVRYTFLSIPLYGILFTIGLYVYVDKKKLKPLLILPLVFLVAINVNLFYKMNEFYNPGFLNLFNFLSFT